MNTVFEGVNVSPVSMEDRKGIGLRAGDTVRVHQKIQDKGKTRIQIFEGLVLARKHGNEAGATFTVRKVVDGIGVEKIYPLYSPLIDKIEIMRRSEVRRAKLYYIREKVAREIRRQMRRMRIMGTATLSETEVAAAAEEDAKRVAAEEADRVAKEEAARAEAAAAEAAKAAEEAAAAAPEPVAETPAEETPAPATPEEEKKD